MQVSNVKEYEEIFKSKCFKCEHIRCIDFFRKLGRLEGNELFILGASINSKKILPCISGDCINCLCKLTLALSKSYAHTPVFTVLLQCIRDLKCSVFLAFCGHYRNAMQILRTVIENLLVGMFFTYLEDPRAFEKWMEGSYKIPDSLYTEVYGKKAKERKGKKLLDYGFILEFLSQRGTLKPKIKTKIESKIISPLNKYLHPHFAYFEISEEWGEHSACPAATKYNENKLKEWLMIFQRISWFAIASLFDMFSYNFFEKDEDAQEGLETLIVAPEIASEYVISKEYQKLVNEISQRFYERLQEFKQK